MFPEEQADQAPFPNKDATDMSDGKGRLRSQEDTRLPY